MKIGPWFATGLCALLVLGGFVCFVLTTQQKRDKDAQQIAATYVLFRNTLSGASWNDAIEFMSQAYRERHDASSLSNVYDFVLDEDYSLQNGYTLLSSANGNVVLLPRDMREHAHWDTIGIEFSRGDGSWKLTGELVFFTTD